MQNLKLVKARRTIPPLGIEKDSYYFIDTNSLSIDSFGNPFCNVYTLQEDYIMTLFIECFTTNIITP